MRERTNQEYSCIFFFSERSMLWITELFLPGLGKVQGYQAQINIKPNAQFQFFEIRDVTIELKQKFEAVSLVFISPK